MIKEPYVLVVEDDEWLAEQHVRTLEAAGIRAHYILDALAAMDELDVKRPDVLVLDVLLPGPNAFTLLHEVRSHNDLLSMPVVLCTNSADRLRQEDVMAYGVVWVLDKTTMYPNDLVAAVRRVLV
jgi:DNA-binding response OmpR family regulator